MTTNATEHPGESAEALSDGARSGYWQGLGEAWSGGAARLERLAQLHSEQVRCSVCAPIDDCVGREAVRERLWRPLLQAMPDLERRDDILLAGRWRDATWVASTGHYMGRFESDWLGIPATRSLVSLRFGEFVRLERGLVEECYLCLDVLDLMRQARRWPLAPALGSMERAPAPATRDGVRLAPADARHSARSLALVEAMIAGLMRYDGRTLESMEQQRFWDRERMMWYGPAGIGSCRGLRGFQDVHQRPFLDAFPDRVGGNHKCRIGEGAYVASTGWPSIRATHRGGSFMGLAPTGRAITMRVMDFWRCEESTLVENWVFIDLIDLLRQLGVDVFARLQALHPR